MRRMFLMIALLSPLVANAQTSQPAASNTIKTAASGGVAQSFATRFAAANTTGDGHLTLAQAQAAGMHFIVKHFAEIDTANAGYVTMPEIRVWHKAQHAQIAAPGTPAAN